MSNLIQSNMLLKSLSDKRDERNEEINTRNYYNVEFDPNLAFGNKESDNEFFLYKDYLDTVNEILDEQGHAPLSFDLKSDYVVDKTKDSKDLDHYNNIKEEIANTMGASELWKENVPSVRRDQSVQFWADKLYAVTKEVQNQTRGLSLNDQTRENLNKLTGEYVNFLKPAWYGWANTEYSEFNNSQSDGIKKGWVDFKGGLYDGLDINLPELLGGGDGIWEKWSNEMREESDAMAKATGLYTMSTEELWESEEYYNSVLRAINNAIVSLPQQVPSFLSTFPALLGASTPIGLVATGVGLGAGYLQESGGFSRDIYDLYVEKRSRARKLKGTMSDDEFNKLFGINLDTPDTKMIGGFKTLDDPFFDNEQLRMMSEQLAQEYGRWSTGLEVVNTIGDVWLGRNARILSKALRQNPETAAKKWFVKNYLKPYGQSMLSEGATEFGQEFISEVKKEANLPEYSISHIQMLESGAIGGMFGLGFKGMSDVASGIANRRKPSVSISEAKAKSFRKRSTEIQEPMLIDNDIVVGFLGGGLNYAQDIANHHDDVTVEDVENRVAELSETGVLTRKNGKRILDENPSILENYSQWKDPFIRKEKEDLKDELPGAELDDPTWDPTLDPTYDPSDLSDPTVSEGLDMAGGQFDYNIEEQEITRLKRKISELEAQEDNPNQIARNEKRARIAEYELKIEELEAQLDPKKLQDKRHKEVIESEAKTDELDIVGKSVTLRTKAQNGKLGKILSYNGSLVKVKTNKGVFNINIKNLEFQNPTQKITDFKKQTSNPKGRKKAKEDAISKKFALGVAKKNNIELTAEEKKLSPGKLKSLVMSKLKDVQKKDAPKKPATKDISLANLKTQRKKVRELLKNKTIEKFTDLVRWFNLGERRAAVDRVLEKSNKGEGWKERRYKQIDDKFDSYVKAYNLETGMIEDDEQSIQAEVDKDFLEQEISKRVEEEVKGTAGSVPREILEQEIREELEGPKEPVTPDDLIDPEAEGSVSQEVSLDEIEALIQEANGEDIVDESIPDNEKSKIVKNVTGRALSDLKNEEMNIDEDDVALDSRVDGKPEIRYYGKQRKKVEKIFEATWQQIKAQKGLTERHFADFVNSMQDHFGASPIAENWRIWSTTRMNKSGFRRHVARLSERIGRGIGDLFTDNQALDNDFQDVFEEAIEYARENIGSMENVIGEEPMSVKDFTKIAKEFFTRYNFNVNPTKMQGIYDQALKFIKSNPETAFNDLLVYLSSGSQPLVTPQNQTLAELIAVSPKARQLFMRFFNSLHTDNTGTSNRGVNGQIIEWEVISNKTSKTLEDQKNKKGGIKKNFRGFRATKKQGWDFQTRPQVSVFRFYTRFIKNSLFSMLKGNDIYQSTGLKSWTKMYGFLDSTQLWNLYRDEFVKFGLVPIASRGEKARLILSSVTEETNNAVKNIAQYTKNQLEKWSSKKESDPEAYRFAANFFKNIIDQKYLSVSESNFLEHVFKGNYDLYREHWIAKHEALKSLFGSDYIFMEPQTIMKRIKIPFTPVYTSPSLPDRKVMYFDANGATLEMASPDGQTATNLTQDIDGTPQYIGDGTTLTSERVFAIDYPEHFGANNNVKRAKTVQYNIDGDDVHMAKHQEMTLDLGENEVATLVNNKGEAIAIFRREEVVVNDKIRSLVNIFDMDGNPIDYLMSNDEAKVKSGTYDKYDTIHTLPGKSIGMIQFSPASQKNKSMFSTQLSYYFDSEVFQNNIMNKFLRIDESNYSPKNLMKQLINWNKSGENINKLIESFALQFYDVVPQNIEELGKLGVGRHPTSLNFLKDVLKKKVLKPIADFTVDGSHLDFRADFRGRLFQDETIIGGNNLLIKKALKRMGKQNHIYRGFEEKIADINNWLKDNKMYTMIVRHPVASSVGFGIYRITEIDPSIGDSFILHPKEVKERFEGDHDHDTGHLIWLDDEFYEDLIPFMRKTKGLNISQYIRQNKNRDISQMSGTMAMIRDMTYGENAIGEIVNASRYAGVLNSIFGPDGFMRFNMGGQEQIVKIRPLTMSITVDKIRKADGTSFKGTLRELLRLYLQASVDHPKLLLLQEWNYERADLLQYLFYDPKDPSKELHEDLIDYINEGLINNVLRLNQEIGNQTDREGRSIGFDDIFEKSGEYAKFIENREEYLAEVFNTEPDSNDPTEQILQDENTIFFEGAQFKENNGRPTSLQELISVVFDRIIDNSGGSKERWYNVTPETSRAVHTNTVRNIKEEVKEGAKQGEEGSNVDYQIGVQYAQQLSDALYALFASKRGNEADVSDTSFITKMSAKTWDYSDAFISFYNKWSMEFSKLSDAEQRLATISFLAGMAYGKNSAQRIDLRMLPPVKTTGLTTLHPDVMSVYFKEYNRLIDEAYTDSERLKEMKKTKPNKVVNELKEEFNCA